MAQSAVAVVSRSRSQMPRPHIPPTIRPETRSTLKCLAASLSGFVSVFFGQIKFAFNWAKVRKPYVLVLPPKPFALKINKNRF